MSSIHLVRIGAFAQIGRFRSIEARRFVRDSAVICRTNRGLELGTVLATEADGGANSWDGELVRGVTESDQLLQQRLDRHRNRAFRACEKLLRQRQLDAVLIDIELLFDGHSLFFYFLGPVDEQVQALTEELAETFEAKARIGQFAKLLDAGCGPDCGTESGAGCSTGGCSGCATSARCGSNATA